MQVNFDLQKYLIRSWRVTVFDFEFFHTMIGQNFTYNFRLNSLLQIEIVLLMVKMQS